MQTWEKIFCDRYAWDSYAECCDYIVETLAPEHIHKETMRDILKSRKVVLGGRYPANIRCPPEKRQIANCFAIAVQDTREDWAQCLHDIAILTMYGGGVGIDVSNLRPYGSEIKSTQGQIAGGPCSFLRAADAMTHELRSCRRGALLGQLAWDHPDIDEFFAMKQGNMELQRMNTSVKYDARWHDIMDAGVAHPWYERAYNVFKKNVSYAITYGDPGFSFNGRPGYERCELANPCAELRTDESHDSCNIGSININHLSPTYDLGEVVRNLPRAVHTLVWMLLSGAKNSMLAVPQCEEVRRRQNRLLCSLNDLFPFYHMVGEAQFRKFMDLFRRLVHRSANAVAALLDMPIPRGYIGIVPSGTGQLIAENCGGVSEPYAECMVRKILQQDGTRRPKYEVKMDPSWKHCLDLGVRIPTSQTITLEESLEFQAMVQDYVDMGISKTINLPARGQPGNDRPVDEIAALILRYHRRLAGLTFYPDNAIEGQPLNAISYEEAQQFLKNGASVLVDDDESLLAISNLVCKGGVCGT